MKELNIRERIKNNISNILKELGIESPKVHLEYPDDISHGDFATNIALIYSKELKMNPKALAERIVKDFHKDEITDISSIDIAGPGFINFKLKDKYFRNKIIEISNNIENFGKIDIDNKRKIMVEYTDPNPFKIFHIGHLMANTIGESISRIIEFSGANVIRACYQGDVGLHVAKTIWAIIKDGNKESTVEYMGRMYVIGNNKYEEDEIAKKEITEINKKIFEKSDEEINKIYTYGRKISLEYFDSIYNKLGTKFDDFFFESEVASNGIEIVKEFLLKGIFEKSEGAIIFPGEKYDLHTRVFINKEGLPTYESKELGLTMKKFDKYPDMKESITITANEQNDYFKVILATLKVIYPDIASKMKHISHGMLRPSSGKMSSRKGNIVKAEDFIEEFEVLVKEKIKDREFSKDEYEKVLKDVSVSALKYTILRQGIGGDIIYDPKKAVSFEGDSGPYLQYSAVRASAVISKAKENGINDKIDNSFIDKIEQSSNNVELLEKLLIRFPEIIERARLEYAPHHIVTYLIEISSAFNSYYANNQIIDKNNPLSSYRVVLTKVFREIMKNGLWILGINVPERM